MGFVLADGKLLRGAMNVVFVGFIVITMLVARLRRQVGGGWGPTELSDLSMTTTPTGYPEEMSGGGKKIGPTENQAGKL